MKNAATSLFYLIIYSMAIIISSILSVYFELKLKNSFNEAKKTLISNAKWEIYLKVNADTDGLFEHYIPCKE